MFLGFSWVFLLFLQGFIVGYEDFLWLYSALVFFNVFLFGLWGF